MSEGQRGSYAESRFRPILRDLHFWVPLAVLLAGLFVLGWIQ